MEKIGVLILALIVMGQISLSARLHTENFAGEKSTKALDTKQDRYDMQNQSQRDSHTSDHLTMESKKRGAGLNFTALTTYLLDRQFFDGGFQIHGGTQSYMNASYFASLALSLVGRFNEIEHPLTLFLGNASTPLNQEGNTTLWGFKDWLMGEVGIRSTSYAILTTNITHSHPQGYNKSTIKYVNKTVKSYLNSTDPLPLFNLSLATLALHSFQDPVHELDPEILDRITASLSNGAIFSLNKNLSTRQNMLKSYLSTLVLQRIHALNSSLTKDIKDFILTRYNDSNTTLQGGFGWDPSSPTVFQTGIALETLALLNSTINSSLINNSIRFVNSSQFSMCGISQSPKGEGKDLFQTVGALLVYHATRKLFKKYDIQMHGPKEQIQKGKEPVNFNVSARFAGRGLPNFLVNSSVVNVSNEQRYVPKTLPYNNSTGLYEAEIPTNSSIANSTNRSSLDFGSYRLRTSFIPNLTGLPTLKEEFKRAFRVGFTIKITEEYPSEDWGSSAAIGPSPGNTLHLTFTAQGATKYLDTDGTFNYKILRINTSSIQKNASISGAYNISHSVNWSVPDKAFWGDYAVEVYLNDSAFGFNHSAGREQFTVWDTIPFTLEGNRSNYSLGESVNLALNLSYNSSGAFPDSVRTKFQFFWETPRGDFLWGGHLRNISAKNNTINTSVPMDLPNSTQIQVRLTFIWGSAIKDLDLFRFNLTLSGFKMTDLMVNGRNSSNLPIGLPFNATFKVREAETNASLVDTVVKAHAKWKNRTIQTLYPYSVNTSYLLNQTLDPNLPEENTTIDFKVPLPWNNTSMKVELESKNITLEGVPHITNVTKDIGLEGEPSSLTLSIARENYPLNGLNLTANVSGKESFTTPVGLLGNGRYLVSFTPEKSGTYKVKIFRNIDDFKLGTYEIHITSKEEPFFKQWREAILIAVICGLVLGYVIVRWWVKKKISKRWLIKRWRRKKEKQRGGNGG